MGNVMLDAHFVRSWSSASGAIAGVLRHLSDERPIDYQMGTTGFAFRINIGERACPSSPRAFNWDHFMARAFMLMGYDCEFVQAFSTSFLFEKRLDDAHALVRHSIDRGLPVIAWHLDLPEFGIIRGYDNDRQVYHIDTIRAEEGEQTLPFDKLGHMGTDALFVLAPGQRFETDEAVCARRAIEYGLFHSRLEAPISKDYETGLAAYQNWIDALRRADVDAFGNSYNAHVLLEARVAASSYLGSVAELFPGEDAGLVKEAAVHYDRAADALLLFTGLFTFPGDAQLLRDEVNLQKGIGWLARARSEESKAIELLDRVDIRWRV